MFCHVCAKLQYSRTKVGSHSVTTIEELFSIAMSLWMGCLLMDRKGLTGVYAVNPKLLELTVTFFILLSPQHACVYGVRTKPTATDAAELKHHVSDERFTDFWQEIPRYCKVHFYPLGGMLACLQLWLRVCQSIRNRRHWHKPVI